MTALGAIFLAGVAGLVVGGLLAAWPGRLGPGFAIQALGTALLGVSGAAVLTGAAPLGAPFNSDVAPALGLDALSGFFVLVLAITAVPALAFAPSYLGDRPGSRAVGVLTAAFLLALTGLLTARDVTTFLGFWELMTLVPAAAILAARRDAPVRAAVFAYLAITHLGGAGVWIAMLAPGPARGDRRSRRARGGRHRHADARRGRRARRLRDQGGARAVALLAAARAPGGARAPVGADVGGDDQGRALRPHPRRVRVARRDAARGSGIDAARHSGCCRRWAGCCGRSSSTTSSGCSPSTRSRTWGSSPSGSGAVDALRPGRRAQWAAIAFAAALLHVANHAIFKALLFLGAGAFERAVGAPGARPAGRAAAPDAVDGRGVPRGLDGDRRAAAPERLRFGVADAPGAAARGDGAAGRRGARGRARARRRWPRRRRWRCCASSRSWGWCCWGATAPGVRDRDGRSRWACAPGWRRSPLLCVVIGVVPGPDRPHAGRAGARGERRRPAPARRADRARHRLPAGTGSRGRAGSRSAAASCAGPRDAARGARRRRGRAGRPCRAGAAVDLGRLHQAAAARARGRAAPAPRGRGRRARAAWCAGHLLRRDPARWSTRSSTSRPSAPALRGAGVARRLQTGNVRTYALYLLALVLGLLALVRTGALG